MFIRYYNHFCPHCGRSYAATLSQHPTMLGSGRRQCKRCKQTFNDGSAEWDELTKSQKFLFVVPNEVMVWLGPDLLFRRNRHNRKLETGGRKDSSNARWNRSVLARSVVPNQAV
jgi:hypothetical protein